MLTRKRPGRSTVVAMLAVLSLATAAGCSSSDGGSPSEQVDAAIDRLKCFAVRSIDADCDGVADERDRAPGLPDYGDADGDWVFNALDRYPGIDDTTIDSDGDTVPDYLDDFFGNNYGDLDTDGIPNGVDAQPFTGPARGQPPASQDNRAALENVVLNSMRSDLMRDMINRGPDTDGDNIPDRIDTTPTEYTNDRDGDGSPDFYDPEPGDPWISERYDPYDPASDAYYDDPYDPSSDAYYDDDNNGWGG